MGCVWRQLSRAAFCSLLVLLLTACGLTINHPFASDSSSSAGNGAGSGSGSGSGSGGSAGGSGSGTGSATTVTVALTGASSVMLGTQSQYTAIVEGSSNTGVVWSIDGIVGGSANVGTISATGLYSAPASASSSPNVTITATSVASPSITQSLAVTLAAPPSTGGSPAPPVVSIALTGPSSVTIGAQAQYVAAVTGSSNAGVSWSVNGIAGGNATVGSISATGMYSAPAALPSSPHVTITATSVASLATSQSLAITLVAPPSGGGIPAPPIISIALDGPSSVTLGGHAQYAATISGTSDTAVNWSVNGVAGGNATVGSISAAGSYDAPASVPSSSVVITATSVASPSASQSLTITLVAPPSGGGTPAPPVVSIALTGPPSVMLGTHAQYAATVTGTSDTAVAWGVNGVAGGNATVGFITSAGMYTAPAALPSSPSVRITATSVASSSISQSLAVTLVAPPSGGGTPAPPVVSIALTGPTSDALGAQAQYVAKVTGSSNTAVVWKVNGMAGGSVADGFISPAGLYSAPSAMPASPNITVAATSVADTAVSQSIAVTLTAPPSSGPGTPTVSIVVDGASSVTLGSPSQYSATVTGSSNEDVTWTVNGVAGGSVGLGVISATGLYTAPADMPTVQTVTIAATSVASPSTSKSIVVKLLAPPSTPVTPPPPPPPPPTAKATSVTVSGPTSVSIGAPVQYTASVAGTSNQVVSWTISPSTSGSIDATGRYTPPTSVPKANQITVSAVSAQTPSVSGQLAVTVLDPIPMITSATATPQNSGQSYLIDVQGDAFLQGANLLIDGAPVATTQTSVSDLQATLAAGGSQTITVIVQNPNPGQTQSAPVTVTLTAAQTTAAAAARLLDQTTFGPTELSIEHVQQVGLLGYLNEQFATSPTLIAALPAQRPPQCSPPVDSIHCVQSSWFQIALTGNDQLRQRVAMALSELWVASASNGYQIVPYQNMLVQDAFTNYRTIMQDVTLSPNMGNFLNMLNSVKPPAGQIANENYARELMQLFTMGLDLLNDDGTLQTDSHGNPIPAYTQAQVQAFAQAYTGWTSANADGSSPSYAQFPVQNWNHPMVAVERQHDASAKVLLNGVTLPAGQSAEQDLTQALDNIFEHPNVGPFVSHQLIQHLVAGNPSPGYVKRVAEVFGDNGHGVRGDMKAVITAILLDPEARAADAQTGDELNANPAVDSGHLREPILWVLNMARGLNATAANTDPTNHYPFVSLVDLQGRILGEPPLAQPTVFNYFSPGYVIPGTTINSPEFGLEDTGAIMPRVNYVNNFLHNNNTTLEVDMGTSGAYGSKAADANKLVDYFDLIFMHSQMPTDMRTAIVDTVSGIPASNPALRSTVAAYLVLTSSQYKIMH